MFIHRHRSCKGETCETAKGVDADGEHAGVWAPSSSWRLPGPNMDFFQFSAVPTYIHYFSSEEGEEAESICSIWGEKVSLL